MDHMQQLHFPELQEEKPPYVIITEAGGLREGEGCWWGLHVV